MYQSYIDVLRASLTLECGVTIQVQRAAFVYSKILRCSLSLYIIIPDELLRLVTVTQPCCAVHQLLLTRGMKLWLDGYASNQRPA